MVIKQCGCGASFTKGEFLELRRVSFTTTPAGQLVAFGTCDCGSTLATVLTDELTQSQSRSDEGD